jgi:hypothetical protein
VWISTYNITRLFLSHYESKNSAELPQLFFDHNGVLGLASLSCDGCSRKITLAVMFYFLSILTAFHIPGSCILFSFTILAKLVISNTTIHATDRAIDEAASTPERKRQSDQQRNRQIQVSRQNRVKAKVNIQSMRQSGFFAREGDEVTERGADRAPNKGDEATDRALNKAASSLKTRR